MKTRIAALLQLIGGSTEQVHPHCLISPLEPVRWCDHRKYDRDEARKRGEEGRGEGLGGALAICLCSCRACMYHYRDLFAYRSHPSDNRGRALGILQVATRLQHAAKGNQFNGGSYSRTKSQASLDEQQISKDQKSGKSTGQADCHR